jgi:hypothetical protein
MAHQHELSILKALADAVVHRKFGANFIKFKAHSKLHGNEVADRIANLSILPPTPYLMWRRTGYHLSSPTPNRPTPKGSDSCAHGQPYHRMANADPLRADIGPFQFTTPTQQPSPGGCLIRAHPPDRQGTRSCQTSKGSRRTPGRRSA